MNFKQPGDPTFTRRMSLLLYPNKSIFLIALALALIMPLHYALWIFAPPENAVFNGYDGMEGHHLAGIRSIDNDFRDYWHMPTEQLRSDNVILSSQGLYGPIYLQLLLGIIYLATSIPIQLLWILLRFFATFVFVLAVYHLISYFVKNENEKISAFILYFFAAGLGGYLYLTTFAASGFSMLPQSLFGFGVSGYRIIGFYVVLPLALSFFSIILNVKGKIFLSSMLAAITIPIYPAHAIITLGLNALYHLIDDTEIIHKIKSVIKLAMLPAIASLVWIIPNVINPYNFTVYFRQNSDLSYVFLPSLIAGIGIPLLFIAYEIYSKFHLKNYTIKKSILISLLLIIFFGGLSISTLISPTLTKIDSAVPHVLQSLGLANFSSVVPIIIVAFLVACACLTIRVFLNKNIDKNYRFLFVWMIVVGAVALLPPGYATIFPDKIVYFLFIPIMIFAAKGLVLFSEKFRIGHVKLLLLIILLSLPTIFAWQYDRQMSTREDYELLSDSSYFLREEYEALIFLNQQPQGTVFASQRISSFTPLYANKRVVLGFANPGVYSFVEDGSQRVDDYKEFYTTNSTETIHSILDKYNVTYIIYDEREQEIFRKELNSMEFLETIFDQGIKIYRVRIA